MRCGVVSQTDLVHHGERPLPHVLAIAPHVGAHDVADLRADGQYGIERERRLLEDDAHRNSTEYLALACGQRPEVASTNRDPARDRGFSRQETEQRQCHRRLAGAGRPGEAHDLATIDREAHVVQYAARCRRRRSSEPKAYRRLEKTHNTQAIQSQQGDCHGGDREVLA